MNNARLDGVLSRIAAQYAPDLLQNAPTDENRVSYLCNNLVNYGLLLIAADMPENGYELLTRSWMDNYRHLYQAFTSILFPLTGGNVYITLVDRLRPPIVLLQAESIAVIQMLAGYVVPYVSMRHETGEASDAEIRGLMAYILDDLEAADIERDKYHKLTQQGTTIIRQLISLPVQQYSLTKMKRPLFQQTNVEPQSVPARPPKPAPPTTLPETGNLNPNNAEKKTKKNETQTTPIWINRGFQRGDTGRMPPVPLPPSRDED